jgi:endogenous inhibitor of DNA gyrase (YacG/DUF329 family)
MMAVATSRCATCGGAALRAGNKGFPFCSERCQLIDLGRWLGEEYRIPAGPADPFEDGGDGGEQRS